MANQATAEQHRHEPNVGELLDTGGARVIGGQPTAGPGPRLLPVATLLSARIGNTANEVLGHLTAIMLAVESGRIAYAVMSSGGVLGPGSKLFAIPWTALSLDADKMNFLLDASKERIDVAPGFDKEHWPTMADYQWAENVHFHYKARPYWLA